MTVQELVKNLMALGIEAQNLPVIIRGYEGGFNDADEIEKVEIAVNHHLGQGYYGKHQILSEDGYEKEWVEDPTTTFSSAIHLVGHNR